MQSHVFPFLFAIVLFAVYSGEINAARLELPRLDLGGSMPALDRQRRSSVQLARQGAVASPHDWKKEKISEHYLDVAEKKGSTKLVVGNKLNKFSIGRLLGAGADGVVHVGVDRFTGDTVALKCNQDMGDEVQNDIAKSKLAREFDFIRRFESPYIIDAKVYKRHSAEVDCLVLEYAPASLQKLVDKKEKRIPVAKALRCFLDVAHGLALLHRHSVVHLDIKPPNIVVFPNVSKIIDFGGAIDLRKDLPDGELRVQKGTKEFLSPEMRALPVELERVHTPVTGLKASDLPKSDIWALGASMCYVLTGSVEAANSAESCIANLENVQIVDTDIHNLLVHMMDRNVDARYNAPKVEAELATIIQKGKKDWLRKSKVPAPN